MIIFSGSGRLGNQIFQLYFLEGIRKPNEKVYCIGMAQVIKYFEGFLPLHNSDNKFLIAFFNSIVTRILKLFVKIHLIGSAIEMHNTGIHKETRGVLPITFSFGYFQNSEYILQCKNKDIRIKSEYTNLAKSELSPFLNKTKVFIHVRHGDYDENVRLPDSFYHKAFELLNADKNFSTENTVFVLLGDDPSWSKKMFGNLPCTFIPENNLITDLSIMTLCDGGIISNSTFAFLGAFFCNRKIQIIAPKYWMNWKTKEWYPKQINTKAFTFIEF